MLLKAATLAIKELFFLSHSLVAPWDLMLKCWCQMKLIISVLSSRSLTLYASKTTEYATEFSAALWHEVWRLCLLELNDSYRNSIFHVGSKFHLLTMPHSFPTVKKKNLIPYRNFSTSSWQSYFLINLEWPLTNFYWLSLPSSTFSSVLGASQALSTETPGTCDYSKLSCWIRNSRFQVNWWYV